MRITQNKNIPRELGAGKQWQDELLFLIEVLDNEVRLSKRATVHYSGKAREDIMNYVRILIDNEFERGKEKGGGIIIKKEELYFLERLLRGGIQITDSIRQDRIFKKILDKLTK